MPDGSHSPDAPIAVFVDGDIKALPFIADLKRAGLRLVQEDGKTYLRPLAECDEPEETERDTIPRLLERAREEINRAEVAYAIELIEVAELLCKRQASWLKHALIHADDVDAITTLAALALRGGGDECGAEAAHALSEKVWPAIHQAERAIGFALRAIDPAAVEDMRLEVAFDDEERGMIDSIEA